MAQTHTINNDRISGRYIKNGNIVSGVTVTLVKSGDRSHVDTQLTDDEGLWEFLDIAPGVYDIWFHEGGASPDKDWIKNILIVGDTDVDDLAYDTAPVLIVSEGTPRVTVNKTEIARANLSFSGLQPTVGQLKTVSVFFKRSSETEYRPLFVHNVVEDEDNLALTGEFELSVKPDYFDFKAVFLNQDGDPLKINGVIYEAAALNVAFDGVSDVFDYIAVKNLESVNTEDSEEGELEENTVRLRWLDFRDLLENAFIPNGIETSDAFGRAYTLDYNTAKIVTSYGVFMFMADENFMPQHRHPGKAAMWGLPTYGEMPWAYAGEEKNDPNGIWVFLGDYGNTDVELRVPRGKFVGFWVGAKTSKTVSQVQTEKVVY